MCILVVVVSSGPFLNKFSLFKLLGTFRYKEIKIYEYDVGHMTKMAVKPIYGKHSSNIFFSGTGGPISTKLGMQHRGFQPITVFSNDNPGLTLTYFTAWSKFVASAFLWEKVNTVDFPETIAASDLKVGRYRQLIKLMKICEYTRSRSFFDLGPKLFTYEN